VAFSFKPSPHAFRDTAFPQQPAPIASSTGTLRTTALRRMQKKMRSCVLLPRRKEGEDGPSRHISVGYEKLERLIHLPLKHAAREIDLSPTTFKKACRRFNIALRSFRQGRRFNVEVPIALRNAQTGDVNAVLVFCQPAGPTRQTPELHQAKRAGTVSSTSPIGAPLPMPQGLSTTRPRGGEQGGATPLETGSPRERWCVEAVMEYLDLGCSISEADVESMLSSDC